MRGLTKPSRFEEGTSWTDWSFSFLAYCELVDPELAAGLTAAAASAIPIGLASDAGESKLQNTLFYLLATLMTGSALVEIKQVVGNN